MKLVLAEKPSVAQSIAKVLGADKRCDGYLEGAGYIVSWCVGHLVELAEPQSYNVQYEKWRYEDLPIIPDKWKYQVSGATKKQFDVLKELMKRNDVESLVCATDAGREGELIFRLVYHQCQCKKTVERLWISSMEDSAIREGFANLKPSTEYDALYEAALCRERADWIVGINATRLFSCLYRQTLNVGRVMTPTLGMAVTREVEISAFKSEPFYTVELNLPELTVVSERMKDKKVAEALKSKCEHEGDVCVTKAEQIEKMEKAPALYDLTSLQRDANKILGFTAQQTLDYTQSLYEKKLVTYPRTDSRYLTDDMAESIPGLVKISAEKFELKTEQSISVSQIINSKKVTDHHAIIPTRSCASADLKDLPTGEREVLKLIACRLLSAVAVPYRYAETVIEVCCEDTVFSAKGKTVIDSGWKAVEVMIRSEKSSKEEKNLPRVSRDDILSVQDVRIKEGKTTPPKHFTEDTLLLAMERAGAEDMPEGVERKGLGTPATRAGIIEKLVRIGFLERVGDKKTKYLIPTNKGTALITVLPEQLQSPSMTAEWEEKLMQIECRNYEAETFMQEICDMTSSLVSTYEVIKDAEILLPPAGEPVGKCPVCGNSVVERQKGWFCSNKQCQFALWREHRFFDSIGKSLSKKLAEELLSKGKAKLKGCKSVRTGKIFDTVVLMKVDAEGKAQFSLEFDGGKRKEK